MPGGGCVPALSQGAQAGTLPSLNRSWLMAWLLYLFPHPSLGRSQHYYGEVLPLP